MKMLLEAQALRKEFGSVIAVDDVSFCVGQGEFVGIMGASGSGKSTLLNLIATIDKATSGTILIDSKDISLLNETQVADFRKNNLAFIFQDYNLLDTLTLRENIALALVIRKTGKSEIDNRIDEIAKKLGVYEVLTKYPYEVSGGQRQRCACARAIGVSSKLILADEPTGALDSHSAKSLMETFEQLNSKMGATLLMVTHDAFSACYCNRILFMKDGKIAREIHKNNMKNSEFLRSILDISAELSGGDGYVC